MAQPESPTSEDLSRWQAKALPAAVTLIGLYSTIQPLQSAHGQSLFEASMSLGFEDRYRYLTITPQDRAQFDTWLRSCETSQDMIFFGVIDHRTQSCEGRQALMRNDSKNGVIEIGNILWGPKIARTQIATEALYLSAKYVFEQLGYRRFEWKCDALNEPSRRAALRFGFQFEGIFRQHLIIKGKNRDTAWFAMIDREWPVLDRAYQAWLAPENFDGAGLQRKKLKEFL
ncbi:MAG: GNAT family protein [Pirellulales bacterium]